MRRIIYRGNLRIIAFVMLTLPCIAISASTETAANATATVNEKTLMGKMEESTLQEWFDANGYALNVSEHELGFETFQPGYYEISVLAEIAEYAPSNNLSWYPISSSLLHTIFLGANSSGDSAAFYAEERFGLCLGTPDNSAGDTSGSQLFYTEAHRNPDGFDHALVFANPCAAVGYIIVWEDLWAGGDQDFQDMILAMLIPVIEADVHIHPSTLNLKSKGRWIACTIGIPAEYEINHVDVSSIRLNETIPAEPKPESMYSCADARFLIVKFSRTLVSEYIKNAIERSTISSKRVEVVLAVSGHLESGQTFKGSARIDVIHMKHFRCAFHLLSLFASQELARFHGIFATDKKAAFAC